MCSPKSTSFHIRAHPVRVLVFSPLIAPVVFSFLFLSAPPPPSPFLLVCLSSLSLSLSLSLFLSRLSL